MAHSQTYRESHTEPGKGKNYHESFTIHCYRKYVWEWEKKIIKSILEKYLTEKSEVLDFACGTGRIVNFLKSFTNNLTGIDVSDSMLEVARKNNPKVNLVKADLSRNASFFGKKQFDILTSFRFFLNAEDPLRIDVLNALHPILKDDGIFVFNNHGNATGLGTLLGKLVISIKNIFRKPNNKLVFNMLSEMKIKKLLAKSGFKIIQTYHRTVLPVMNEQTRFNISRLEGLEDLFSDYSLFRPFARNIIYVCKKKP